MSTSPEESPAPGSPDNQDAAKPEAAEPASEPQGAPASGLPDVEPLTPEIVEDEALRGDFMLRAFVLVLAVLLAFTEIAETQTLVHVKTGQYLAAHGWLPPGVDVFSFTAEGRPWYNLSWLFDLALAGAYAVGGAKALTVLKAAIVALTFFLVTRCVRPGVSTWWGSIAAALALLACHPNFTALPEVVTLLGLAVVLWILHRWQASEENSGVLWWLVPAFMLWSNLDNRMFLGLSLLALYAVGDLIGSLIGVSGLAQSERRRQLWMVLAVCVAAACLNPFGWQALAEPMRLYGVEYPEFRVNYEGSTAAVDLQYFPLFGSSVIGRPHVVAGLVLLAAALIAIVLNRRQLDLGHVFVLLGFGCFAAAASQELAAAAIVACVLATLNGQDWYRESFSQAYSVEFKERLFSSGGRAATVLALFAIAFLAASGRMKDPAGRRIGLGFHPELRATIDGMKQDVEDSFDDRPFNFALHQGDLLIWIGQQPFIDSRLPIYAGAGRDDLLAIHRRARLSLRRRIQGLPFSGRDEVWKQVFDRFEITRALPRLSGASPDYFTFFSLQQSPQWTMTDLGSMTASIYRTDTRVASPRLDEYLKERSLNLVDDAFQREAEELEMRGGWPQPRTAYQRFLTNPRHERPVAVQTALHYDRYLQEFLDRSSGQITVPFHLAAATAHLAIRHANRGLAENPDSADAFQVLGDAYGFLNRLESTIAGEQGDKSERRYRQTIAAYHQAAQIEPRRSSVQSGLFVVYFGNQKLDLAVRALRRFDELTDFESDESDAAQAQQTGILEMQGRLQRDVESRLQQIDVESAKGSADSYRIAQFAYGQGCVLRALELLEQDPTLISERPDVQLFYGVLLHETGRVQEAAEVMQSLEGMAAEIGLPAGWQTPAAWTRLANGDYEGAISLWSEWGDSMISQQMLPAMTTLAVPGPSLAWTPLQSQNLAGLIGAVRTQTSQTEFDVALTRLEAGQLQAAAASFRKAVRLDPNSPHRPLAEFYHIQLKGEPIDVPPPLDRIPLDPRDMFAAEE